MGDAVSYRTKQFLQWMGMDQKTVNKMSLDSIRNRKFINHAKSKQIESDQIVIKNIHFTEQTLPGDARPITLADTKYVDYIENTRGLNIGDYPFKITPNASARNRNRILIPYYYANEIVGWTSRYLDAQLPKYYNEHQEPGYVFGTNLQKESWNYAIVVEGPFDAISINGLAVLHNEINDMQMALLRRLDKEIIVVPDQNRAGIKLAEIALDAGFDISIPEWDNDIEDVNDAVRRYGKVGTLLSIISNKTDNRIKGKIVLNNFRKRKGIL